MTDPERATMQFGEVLDEGLCPSNRPDSPRPWRMKSVRKGRTRISPLVDTDGVVPRL